MFTYKPTYYIEDAAVVARTAEVPAASWVTGGNAGGSNSAGLGINVGGGNIEPLGSSNAGWGRWTIIDQFGDPRTGQVGESIGGEGFVDRATVPWPESGGLPFKGVSAVIRNVDDSRLMTGDGDVAPGIPEVTQLFNSTDGWVGTT